MCNDPRPIKRDGEVHSFPCNNCEKCTKRRVSGWSFRLMQQEKISSSAYFLTLTYEPEHCPFSKNGFMDLRKGDLQLFFKRLRKRHTEADLPNRIKYYAVGEYGGKSRRPHYHVIIFNMELELMIGKKYADLVKAGTITLDGATPFQGLDWKNGHITLGQVTKASVGYTLKYINKPRWKPMHRNDDREPQFSLMSKKLGANYLSEAIINYHKEDLLNRMCLTIEDGKKIAMPRYYKDKIYDHMERSEIAGFQKGEIERKMLEEISTMTHEKFVESVRNKKEAVKASFERQKVNANNGETL